MYFEDESVIVQSKEELSEMIKREGGSLERKVGKIGRIKSGKKQKVEVGKNILKKKKNSP